MKTWECPNCHEMNNGAGIRGYYDDNLYCSTICEGQAAFNLFVAKNAALEAENRRLRAALQYYANPDEAWDMEVARQALQPPVDAPKEK